MCNELGPTNAIAEGQPFKRSHSIGSYEGCTLITPPPWQSVVRGARFGGALVLQKRAVARPRTRTLTFGNKDEAFPFLDCDVSEDLPRQAFSFEILLQNPRQILFSFHAGGNLERG
jgi:hypothetical protein